MEIFEYMNYFISFLFMLCYAYQFMYVFVPHIKQGYRYICANIENHRYAVLICARNEEKVISRLIESIKQQDYPADLVEIFVVADNCTDATAAVAKRRGANVYVRQNRALVGKGYAMEFLLDKIDEDWGRSYFDGYFVFDADNIIAENYISEMNKMFSRGHQVITSYRNSKNYGENRISAGCGLWFLRESYYLQNSRFLLGHSACVSGTGFMFSDRVYRKTGGWNFHLLTEDIEFSAWCITNNIKIAYCNTAHFYDEQPTDFFRSRKQRLRWAKGNFQVLGKYKSKLAKGAAGGSFSCLDMMLNIMPAVILTIAGTLLNIISCTLGVLAGRDMAPVALSIVKTFFNAYGMFFAMGLLTVISQWRHIHTTAFKKIFYTFTFPLFMMTYVPISLAAVFADVTWRPIAHTKCKSLAEVRRGK